MISPLLEEFSQQLRQSVDAGRQIQLKPANCEIHNVVVASMGSEGTSATLVEGWVFDQIAVPIIVIKSYEIPAFVNKHTLFVASSISGNTEEVSMALEQAVARNATIVCITAGGKLLQLAQQKNYPLAQLPGNMLPSRAFIRYTFIQLLFILKNYELIGDAFVSQLEKAIVLIDSRKEVIQAGALDLAKALTGKLPVLYADAKLYPVLLRFQQQINETARQMAHVNVFPEMNYNELAGWVHPTAIIDKAVVVLVQTAYDHARVRIRMDICRPILAQKADAMVEIQVRHGSSLLEQSVYLIYLLDWASFYLANQNGVDTSENKVLDQLDRELDNSL